MMAAAARRPFFDNVHSPGLLFQRELNRQFLFVQICVKQIQDPAPCILAVRTARAALAS